MSDSDLEHWEHHHLLVEVKRLRAWWAFIQSEMRAAHADASFLTDLMEEFATKALSGEQAPTTKRR